MAVGLPAAFLEPYASTIASYTISELQKPVDISSIAPRVAGIDPFIQIAQQRAAMGAGLGQIQRGGEGEITGFTGGTGISSYEPYIEAISQQGLLEPGGYQQYMSPYQQSVIDQATQALQRQEQIAANQRAAQATQAGAYGGARFGVQEAEAQSHLDRVLPDAGQGAGLHLLRGARRPPRRPPRPPSDSGARKTLHTRRRAGLLRDRGRRRLKPAFSPENRQKTSLGAVFSAPP